MPFYLLNTEPRCTKKYYSKLSRLLFMSFYLNTSWLILESQGPLLIVAHRLWLEWIRDALVFLISIHDSLCISSILLSVIHIPNPTHLLQTCSRVVTSIRLQPRQQVTLTALLRYLNAASSTTCAPTHGWNSLS